jgi:hypothetical protein
MPTIPGTRRREYLGGFDVSALTRRYAPGAVTRSVGDVEPEVRAEDPAFAGMTGQAMPPEGGTTNLKAMLDGFDAENAAAFTGRLRNMAQFSPDDVAAKYTIKRRTGAPIVDLKPDAGAAERLAAVGSISREQVDALRKDRPAFYKRVMEDPAFAAMVTDDWQHTAEAEGLWQSVPLWLKANLPIPLSRKDQEALPALGRDIGRRYRSGQVQFSQQYLGNQLASHVAETGQYDEGILDTLDSLDEELAGLESSEDRGFVGGIPEAMAEQATNLAGGLAARGFGLLGGPAGVGAAGFAHGAATETGHAMADFSRMTDEDGNRVDPRMALGFATTAGALNGALEIVGGGTMLRALPGNSALKKKLSAGAVRVGLKKILANKPRAEAFWKVIEPHVTSIMVEPTTEAIQRFVTIAAGELAKDSSFDDYDMQVLTGDTLKEMLAEAEAGLQVAVGMGVSGTAQRAVAGKRQGQGQATDSTDRTDNRTDSGGPELPRGVPAGPGDAIDTTVNPVTGEPFDAREGGGGGVQGGPRFRGDDTLGGIEDDLGDAAAALGREMGEVQAAQREGVFLERLGEWASKGLLTQRSPEAVADFIDDVARRAVGEGIETVRVSAADVRDIISRGGADAARRGGTAGQLSEGQGQPPEGGTTNYEIAQELRRAVPDFDKQMAQAEQVGGDLLIGLGNYAAYVAPGKSGKALQGLVKLRPGGMTAKELDENRPEIEATLRGLMERQADERVRATEEEALVEALVQEREAEILQSGAAMNSKVKKSTRVGAILEVQLLRRLSRMAGVGLREGFDRFRARVLPGSAQPTLAADAAQLDQDAYHGSPHEFDKFSTAKMGTGEGAQAYGWGMYFAENRDVAEYYRDKLSKDIQRIKSDAVAAGLHGDMDVAIYNYSIGKRNLAIKQAESLLSNFDNYPGKLSDQSTARLDKSREALEQMRAGTFDFPNTKGRLYTVDLAPEEDEYLLWDKPLSEQSEKVKAALQAIERPNLKRVLEAFARVGAGEDAKKVADAAGLNYLFVASNTAGSMYDAMESRSDGGARAVSQALLDAGIRGIKYLDGSSRGKGEGDYNYVIFDDKDVTITRLEQAIEGGPEGQGQDRATEAQRDAEPADSGKGGEQGETAKGRRGSFLYNLQDLSDRESWKIELTPKANWSTFVHELGHWYLFALNDLAKGSEQAARDLASILKYVGAESVETMTTEQHELWADTVLKYLEEGKVPEGAGAQVVAALKSFQRWLTHLWKTKQLQAIEGIEISDEVREVLDSMVGADAAIDEARHQSGARALFVGRNDLNMTEAEYAEYVRASEKITETANARAARRRTRAAKKHQSPEWKAKLEALTAEIRDEIEASKPRRTRKFIQTGVLGADDTEPQKSHKLDAGQTRAILSRMKDGAKLIKELKTGPKGLTKVKGGLHPQAVAELFGYKDAEAMLREVIPMTNERADALARRDAKERMRAAEQPDPTETIEKQATDDLMNPWMEKVALMEIEGAERITGRRRIPVAALRKHAEEHLTNFSLSSIRPDEHVREMKRQQNIALRALQRGDYEALGDARRTQLAHYYIYKAAREAEREVRARTKDMARYERPSLRGKLGTIYTDQIDALKGKFHLSEKGLPENIEPLDEFLKREEQMTKPVDKLKPWIVREMGGAGRSYRTLTMEQFRELHEAMQNIETLGHWERESRLFDERIDVEAMGLDLNESVRKNNKPRARDKTGRRERAEKIRKNLRGLSASLVRIESLARKLDGGDQNGPVWRYIVKPVQKGLSRFRELEQDAIEAIAKVTDQYSKDDWNRMIDGMTFEKWFMLALNRGNPGNWGRAIETARAGEIPGIDLVEGEDDAVLAIRLEQKLDEVMEKRDWDAVQAIWKLNEKYRPLLEELELRTRGYKPRWIKAEPFDTRHGRYDGGYFRIMYDPDANVKVEQREADLLNPEEMQKVGWVSPLKTRDGMVQERKGSGGATLRLDLTVVGRSLQETLFRVAMQDVAMHLGRVFRDQKIAQLLKDHMTDGEWAELQDWARRVLRIREADHHPIEPAVRHMGLGVAIGGLGHNAMVIGLQPLGYAHSVQYLGPKYALKGTQRFMESLGRGTMQRDVADVYARSEFMRNRGETRNVVLNDLRERLTTGKAKKDRWNASNFYFIQKMQWFPDMMTWWGAYEKAAEADPSLSDEDLVALADQAVRETQGSGSIADASSMETHNALLKALSPFYSYYNVKWNLLRNSGARFMRDVKGEHPGKAYARFASDLLLLTVVEQQIAGLVKSALDSSDDDDPWWKWLLKNQFYGMFALLPIVRDIPSMIEYGSTGGGVIGRAEQDILRAWQKMKRLGGKAMEGEVDSFEEDVLPALKGAVTVGNYGPVHYPSGFINRVLQGMADFPERQEERGTAAAVGGLFFNMGRPENRDGEDGGVMVE